eukprot:CAMPEP_0196589012 /NCGR_PEP_ID=MMETSP1081-20130531/62399_1 /TAXON_ID=36882 /ORGANISM="Pyramimonas amylifera, Strain CCMP720" /LENGTH=164 /DNA_ID=CAMNT_0041911687 /DNA_START=179 /DNA_END=673 /DNA_ORIENTATION=+
MDRTVVMPILRPVGFIGNEEYKLSLAFEGERFVTQWLPLIPAISKEDKYFEPSMIRIILTHDRQHIRGVSASLQDLPAGYDSLHAPELHQLNNATHWPKHVLLQYTWNPLVEVDQVQGMNFLLGTGVFMMASMLYIVSSMYNEKISVLVNELADDDDVNEEKTD